MILPDPREIGGSPLATLVLCVDANTCFIASPSGIGGIPRRAWPPPAIIEVYSPLGQLIWKRGLEPKEPANES